MSDGEKRRSAGNLSAQASLDDFLYFTSRHVYNQPACCFRAIQIFPNLSRMVLARIRCWCHIALPVEYEFRSPFKIVGNGIDDTSHTNGFVPFGRPKLKHSKFRLQHLTILRHDWQLKRTDESWRRFPETMVPPTGQDDHSLQAAAAVQRLGSVDQLRRPASRPRRSPPSTCAGPSHGRRCHEHQE